MAPPPLFLETTIQIERVLGSRTSQATLHAELANYRLVTSRYVLGEYLRTVVKDAVYLHRVVTSIPTVDDAMTAIAQHQNKKEASRMMLLMGALLRMGSSLAPTTAARHDLLDRLARMIDVTLVNRFTFGIDQWIDDVECGLANERPQSWQAEGTFSYQLRSQCIRRVRECALDARLAGWRPQLEKIVAAFQNDSDPVFARMSELAAQINDDPIVARGRNCTWYLGDLVIALELPVEVPLYTTNRRHFAPLLEVLGKQLHIPVLS